MHRSDDRANYWGAILGGILLASLPFDVQAQPAPEAASPPVGPTVTDPMLVAPPAAPKAIASWDDALSLIRAQSPDYVSSAQSVTRAEAQKRIALAAILPMLNAQAGYVHQFNYETVGLAAVSRGAITAANPVGVVSASIVTPAPDAVNLSGTVTWAALNPRAIYAVGTADENIDVTKLSFDDRRRLIATSVVDAMLATLAAEHVAELNRVGLRAALERQTLTQARFTFGQGTALDVDRATQDVEAARALIISGDESLREAREALGLQLGSNVAMAAPGSLDLEAFETAVAHTCHVNDDIERRPDVRAAAARVRLAERGVRDAELLFSPYIDVSSQLAYSTAPILAPDWTWSLGATLSVPIFDGGARYGALRDARAALEQARQSLIGTRLSAIVGSEQALRSVSVLSDSRDVAKTQRDLADRIDQRTRDGYAHGLGTSLDLVTSAQALRQAEINLALLEFQVAMGRANAVLVNAECAY
jgi:outer membrane protein TolC